MNKIKRISILIIILIILGTIEAFAATGTINTNESTFRKEASTSSEAYGYFYKGDSVEVIEKSGDWYKIKSGDNTGFIYGTLIDVPENITTPQEIPSITPEQVPVESPADSNKTITKVDITNVYVMPILTSKPKAIINKGTEIKVQKSLNKWSYITSATVSGWIRTYCIEEKNMSTNPDVAENPTVETAETEPIASVETEIATPPTTVAEPVINTEEIKAPSITKGYISVDAANVRKETNTSCEIVTTLTQGTAVEITGENSEWFAVKYGEYVGYTKRTLISETPVVTNRGNVNREQNIDNTEVQTVTENQNQPISNTVSLSLGDSIADLAIQYLGYKYVYGGTTPKGGFDCTGFTYYIYNTCGIKLSRSCSVQASSGIAVSKAELQLGDLLLFDNTSDGSIGHVGIYIGDGMMIHSANPTRGVVKDTINSGYYNTYYYSARRLTN